MPYFLDYFLHYNIVCITLQEIEKVSNKFLPSKPQFLQIYKIPTAERKFNMQEQY